MFHLLGVGINQEKNSVRLSVIGTPESVLKLEHPYLFIFLFSCEKRALELPAHTQMVFPGDRAHAVPQKRQALPQPKSAGKVFPTKSTMEYFSFCTDLLRC